MEEGGDDIGGGGDCSRQVGWRGETIMEKRGDWMEETSKERGRLDERNCSGEGETVVEKGRVQWRRGDCSGEGRYCSGGWGRLRWRRGETVGEDGGDCRGEEETVVEKGRLQWRRGDCSGEGETAVEKGRL